MTKRALSAITLALFYTGIFCQSVYPTNQKTGQLSYSMIFGPGGLNPIYRFVLKMTVDCSESAPGLFQLYINDLENQASSFSVAWQLDSASNDIKVADPCIVLPVAPCRRICYYHADAVLPFNTAGYSVFYPDCCRDYYQNLRTDFNASIYDGNLLKSSWSADDPTRPGAGYIYNSIAYLFSIPSRFKVNKNSSPVFDNSGDTVLNICRNTEFGHLFTATDPDGDSLVYSLTPAKIFSAYGQRASIIIQSTGNIHDAMYNGPLYSPDYPLGMGVSIDPKTGFVHGAISDTGSFLLTVGVSEYRNGSLVTQLPITRDMVIKVFDCDKLPLPKANIPPLINSCNATTVLLPNNTTPYHPELYWDNNTYLWDLGDGDTSQVRYPLHTYDTGTYNIRLITMAGYRCADTAYSKLLVYPSVHPSFAIDGNGCTGQPVRFINTSTTDIGQVNSLLWTFTNLKDSSYFTSALSTPTYAFKVPDQTYSAILDITTTRGCEAMDTQYINIRQSPLRLQTHDTVVTSGVPFRLFANSGYDTTGSTYIWSPSAGLDDPFSANPVATGTNDITYKVQESNMYGCSLTDTIHLTYYKGPDIYVPLAFTPNGDGKNDIFRPFPVGIQRLEYFRVFDRWGNLVYQTQAYLAGWDGSINGRQAPAGTYIYEVRGKDYNGKVVFKKGPVLLIR
ncbi:MAG TPA: gliding motility-associated C-terminal domain-containing protein [Chitinophagaceae bacterium]|nr:gliding motility-associated C-terminal domain-containing protein [Chitinophagaceae bacterium]